MKKQPPVKDVTKEFISHFKSLCYAHNSWNVWHDFIFLFAVMIAFAVNREQMKEQYKDCSQIINKYSSKEQAIIQELASLTIRALEENPEQDFLGKLYMRLNLANKARGQEFTPYNVSRMIAQTQAKDARDKIAQKGWISVYDPTCGSCGMLVAFRNEMVRQKIPYQNVLFVGQEIDHTTALMGYIQMSLLGCAGYVVIGNTLTNPLVGTSPLLPCAKDGQEIWYTPMFFDPVWHQRQVAAYLSDLVK